MAGRLGWRDSLTISDVYRIIKRNLRPYCQTKELQLMKSVNELQKNWFNWGLFDFDPDRLITRREICIIVDNCLIIFNNKNLPVDFNGKLHFVYSKF
jgi:ATP-dependent protease HslVU (ClpYQ) peptidase subunit